MSGRRFRVNVNGKTFEVVVEELDGQGTVSAGAQTARPKAPASTMAQSSAAASAAVPEKAAAPAPTDGPGWISCPMAGKIQKIPVKIGDSVKPDTVVAVLEAMKMETSINAGISGTVTEIAVTEGTVVEGGAKLVRCA